MELGYKMQFKYIRVNLVKGLVRETLDNYSKNSYAFYYIILAKESGYNKAQMKVDLSTIWLLG